MMGRQRLEELKRHGRELVEDGHREGSELLELTDELDRMRAREWTPVRLCDALDTIVALYLLEPQGPGAHSVRKGLTDTSVIELVEWSGRQLRTQTSNVKLAELDEKLREVLAVLKGPAV
jgi:hypothetical protein